MAENRSRCAKKWLRRGNNEQKNAGYKSLRKMEFREHPDTGSWARKICFSFTSFYPPQHGEACINSLMRPGKSSGAKTRALSTLRNAFEIIHLRTGRNPVEVLAKAVENSAPCEDTTRISYGGVVYHMAVDISPQRRVDLAIRLLSEGSRKSTFGNSRTLEECIADELVLAALNDVKSFAVSKRNEMERIAMANR